MASKTLGPFPKTVRWGELVGSSGDADGLLRELQVRYAALVEDPEAHQAIYFWVGLVIASRFPDPSAWLFQTFGIEVDPNHLLEAVGRLKPHPLREALARTLAQVEGPPETLFAFDPWEIWREFDGPAFCDLARRFYGNLNGVFFENCLETGEAVERLGREMATITRTFSARWFNACAKDQTPDAGSIRWYFGHCMGKLDLELAREASDWDEGQRGSSRRKRPVPPRLPF